MVPSNRYPVAPQGVVLLSSLAHEPMHQRLPLTRFRSGLALLGGLSWAACSTAPASSVAGPVPKSAPAAPATPTAPPKAAHQSATRAESTRAYALPTWAPFDTAIVRGTRTRTGEPGPAYWQQWAEYKLEAELNPVSKRLNGRGTITYQNNSPDTLPTMYIQAYGNIFAPEAKRNTPVLGRSAGSSSPRLQWRAGHSTRVHRRRLDGDWNGDGTEAAETAPPGHQRRTRVRLESARAARRPRGGGRTARSRYISYWYPQMAVYDDVNGWQIDQYLGNAEFYMGYGNYDVALTVPAGWLVDSHGHAAEPRRGAERPDAGAARLARAPAAASCTWCTESDRGAGKATHGGKDGKLTWRFKAENVRDVAWATSQVPLGRDHRGRGRREGRRRARHDHDLQSFYRTEQRRSLGRGAPATASTRSVLLQVALALSLPAHDRGGRADLAAAAWSTR